MPSFFFVQALLCSIAAGQQYLPTASFANNAPEASAYSFLPFAGVETSIEGRFDFQSQSNGSTQVTFSLMNVPQNSSFPITYFIAESGVPSNGDCYLAGPVFDPSTSVLATCDIRYPQACKVGDLSGKSGNNITRNSTGGSYIDPFLSFSNSSSLFFVSRSIVLLDSNNTRLACSNITSISTGSGVSSSNNTSPAPVSYVDIFGVSPTNTSGSSNASTTGRGTSASGTSGSGSGSGTSSGSPTPTTSGANSNTNRGIYAIVLLTVTSLISLA